MIRLSPIDYYFYRPDLFTVQFVFEYQEKVSVSVLRKGLDSLPSSFDVAKMVLVQRDASTLCLELKPDAAIPITESHLSGTLDLAAPDQLATLVMPVTNELEKPLVRFHLSHLTDRTLVGVSFSHILGDGFSFIMFLRGLARTCQGLEPDYIPTHNRSFLEPKVLSTKPQALNSIFADTGFSFDPALNAAGLEHQLIFFTREQLAELKLECQAGEPIKISDNDVIMASLIKKFAHKLPLTESGHIAVRCPVDLRNVFPGISKTYFGNGIKDAMALFNPSEFSDLSLSDIIQSIRSALSGINLTVVEKYLNSLRNIRLQNGIDIFQKVACPGLLVTNLSRLPFYEINFGSGAPTGFQTVTPCPRLAVILPDPKGFKVSTYLPV